MNTVFTQVNRTLGTLMDNIEIGEIGLPDIQRPFVWKNVKVRQLFDSMYRGYPIGYLLFWKTSATHGVKAIGSNNKQLSPSLVIVDGQQRLTSLYAVIKNIPVLRKGFETERIQVAFNPLEERFEVADASILRDKLFMSDISLLWSRDTNVIAVIREYLTELESSRGITDEERTKIENSIMKVHGLISFPFTSLELSAEADAEAVSEIFVRINSAGETLNQSDFILTLMSVFWDEGRTTLERFCLESHKPSTDKASPFNYFIEPSPDQLLRVAVGVAFKRARLKYVYSILRGKDLETEKFSDELRDKQFELLKNAQERTLNLQYWHDFMNCLRLAGFRSGKMITSQNNLIFSYILYLIGRTEYKVSEFKLRAVIARWFFMSNVTGRFTGSPESAMEFDLAELRSVNTAEEFTQYLDRVCNITLSSDYWSITLPNDLATSSSQSPSLFAYNASLVLLDSKVLFSKALISDLLDPSIHAHKSAVERHHLYPKGYLAKLDTPITSTRDTNQIANYAYVEWGDNIYISDQAPSEYLPEMKERYNHSDTEKMYRDHALPENWEHLSYLEFLEKRRELIAKVIERGYAALSDSTDNNHDDTPGFVLADILADGESEVTEFKSTLRTNLHTSSKDPRMESTVLKTIAGFLNVNGGTLIVGVSDDGVPIGIDIDGFANEDKMGLHLVNIVKARLGMQALTNIHVHFDDYEGSRVMIVKCNRSSTEVFMKDGEHEKFYIRTGPSTTDLSVSQTSEYIKQRF